jgi:hypothetical protein
MNNDFDITQLAAEHGIELGGDLDYTTNPYAGAETEQEYDSKVGAYNLLDLPDTATSKYEPSEFLSPDIDYTNALQKQIADNNVDLARGQEAEVIAEFAHYQHAAEQDTGFKNYLEQVEYGANSDIKIDPDVADFMEHKFGYDVDDLQHFVAYYKLTPSEISDLERKILGDRVKHVSDRIAAITTKPQYQDDVEFTTRSNTTSEVESVDVGDMNLLVENLKHQHGLTEEGIQTTLAQAFDYLSQNPHLNEQVDTREKVLEFFGQFVPKKSPPKTDWKQAATQARTSGESKQQVRGGSKAKPNLGGKMVPFSNITKLSEQDYAANIDRIERLYQSGLIDYSK